jgi:hypothetical protein
MYSSQRNIRIMHHIGEFLDLDVRSSQSIAEFLALIQALREGLTRIDDYFDVPDFHLNVLFLSKLEAHPDWKDWAKHMLQDRRLNAPNPADRMKFDDLARLAIQREQMIKSGVTDKTNGALPFQSRIQALTQEEINSFVVRQMRKDGTPNGSRGHHKRPSQEEINDYVVRQMRKEQERKTRARSKSQPDLRKDAEKKYTPAECYFCGAKDHPGQQCRQVAKKVTAEVPRADISPKRVEFRTEVPGGIPPYRTGFALT